MILSDTSVKRPVFAIVISLLICTFGLISFERLPLREYPDVDTPVVSVVTRYVGAAAKVVESRITQLIEDQVAGVEGIESISSTSSEGLSQVVIEFSPSRDIDAAANDVRDRVSRLLGNLPEEADPPEVVKVDSGSEVIMWLSLASTVMNTMELSDFAQRNLVDRFSAVDGVAQVRVGGERRYAMRVWINSARLASRGLTVGDVESALRRENLELPAGRVESSDRELTVRLERPYATEQDFRQLVVARGADGYLVRLGDVADVEVGPEDTRTVFRGNGESMVGIGIVKQSTANTVEVARLAKAEAEAIRPTLPPGTALHQSYDSSIFIEGAVDEVYETLGLAVLLVALVIYLFLGSSMATLIPVVTVPVSIIGSCVALYALGYSINLFTLLAMVLAIGMVVDDTIVVVENIVRRMEAGEPPLLAAYRGTREVGFAVVATTLVLVAVFAPLSFLEGRIGRLFVEFAMAMSAAVVFSSLVALTLAPVMGSWLLKPVTPGRVAAAVQGVIDQGRDGYDRLLGALMPRAGWVLAGATLLFVSGLSLWWILPRELAPQEDRGSFFVRAVAPEGTGLQAMTDHAHLIEQDLMELLDQGLAQRILVRVPGAFGSTGAVNSAMAIVLLKDWRERDETGHQVLGSLMAKLERHPGFRTFGFMRQGLSRGLGRPVRFVIGGPTYEELVEWRDIMAREVASFPGLVGVDFDYKETKPQVVVKIDTERAADVGVSYADAARTLETLFASRRVTTFERDGEEYEVMLEARPEDKDTVSDLTQVYVRSATTGQLVPLSGLAHTEELADAGELQRFNRRRSITLEASLAEGTSLGEALTFLEETVRRVLPPSATIDYKGEFREYQESSASLVFVLLVALAVVFLVLAAQFESFVQPLVIMLTVPLAVVGALVGLWLADNTLNIYSQIGVVMLIGLAAKNGILVVEFANQLRDRGVPFDTAITRASVIRLRPILMTGISTAIGALPLVLASGPGAETRLTLGLVILFGVASATVAAVLVVPAAYRVMTRNTGSPGRVARMLSDLESRVAEVASEDAAVAAGARQSPAE